MLEDTFSELEQVRLKNCAPWKPPGLTLTPRAEQTHTSQEAIEAFIQVESQPDASPIQVTVAGRIRSLRPMGKLTFAHIQDRDGKLQLFFRVNDLGEEKWLN